MNRIATMTVVRGSGNVEAIMNGIVNQEIKRLRAKELEEMEAQRREFEKEMGWMNMIKKQRDRERAQHLKEKYNTVQARPRKKRAREKVGFVLACLICWGEALCLFEHINEEEEK